jgi:hypothetical protein
MDLDLVRLFLRYAHFFAWAALIGATLSQLGLTNKKVSPAALWGGRLAFLSGLLLVGIKEAIAGAGGAEVNHAKVGAKLLLALVPLVLLEISARKGLRDGAFWGTLASTGVAMAVAVFWV